MEGLWTQEWHYEEPIDSAAVHHKEQLIKYIKQSDAKKEIIGYITNRNLFSADFQQDVIRLE